MREIVLIQQVQNAGHGTHLACPVLSESVMPQIWITLKHRSVMGGRSPGAPLWVAPVL